MTGNYLHTKGRVVHGHRLALIYHLEHTTMNHPCVMSNEIGSLVVYRSWYCLFDALIYLAAQVMFALALTKASSHSAACNSMEYCTRSVDPADRLDLPDYDLEVGGSNLSAGKVGLIFRISCMRGPAARTPTGDLFRRGRSCADARSCNDAVQRV